MYNKNLNKTRPYGEKKFFYWEKIGWKKCDAAVMQKFG